MYLLLVEAADLCVLCDQISQYFEVVIFSPRGEEFYSQHM